MRKILYTGIMLLLAPWQTTAQSGLIDRVVAVVGNEMILYSDIESEVNLMRVQGVISDKNIRCEVLENLLLQKLLLAQARIDSLKATDDEVDMQIDQRLRMMMAQLGGEKATEDYFHKPVFQLKREWRETIREQILTQRMQAMLTKDAPITPDEVKKAYRKMAKDSLPIIPIQYVLRQIVVFPPAADAKFDVRERLLELRERIVKGEKFSTLAILYSEDPGNRMRGGELGLRPRQELAAPFANAAMALKPGQVSPIVETEFGFHIIQLIEKEGDMFNARHILMRPQYTSDDRATAFRTLDSISTVIKDGSLTFEQAALRLSQDPKTAANGGLIVNEYNLSSRFEKDQLHPSDYGVLRDMQPGDISVPFETTDKMGNTQYKILQLVELIPSHPATVDDDYAIVQQLAQQQQQQQAFNAWISQKQASTYIRLDDDFKQCAFQRTGWVK
ncbi:MAG: peptidylprolyl isomerase [Prevotellaceae bacterium]|jgi:peptidyl-prolyl cis-trans isomerase SurA|nr:peptidylprolyl isomerase [Prevotellaceae bacterium]